MSDQPAQGSTADYCSRWPVGPHAISVHMRGGTPSVRRCGACGWIDHDDLQAQADAAYERGKAEAAEEIATLTSAFDMAETAAEVAYERGLAEGRRQATEGWEREWAVRYPDGYVYDDVSEAGAREIAARYPHRAVVSRLVGPWEPAVQPEHAFDESSVVNPATGEPYRGSSGPEPYEPPDPLCVCGASWLGDEGCLTQQPEGGAL